MNPMVLPIPFSIERTASPRDIPSAMATDRDTITKEIKESNLNTRINISSRQIPRTTMRSGIYYFTV
jgi:hypothetical protein